jgi:hypothetical protein
MDENTKPTATGGGRLLGREEILAKHTLITETVNVPEWKGRVRVRELTGLERDTYEAALIKMQKGQAHELTMDNARARLVALASIDQNGARLFTIDDVESLGNLSAAALSRVFDVAARLSKITDADLEELAGNLPGAPSADSGLSSPSSSASPSGSSKPG